MEFNELITQLRSVSVATGSLVCLGCGHEHHCGIHGCAILRAAVDRLMQIVTDEDSRQILHNQIALLEREHKTLTERLAVMKIANDGLLVSHDSVYARLAERDNQFAAAVEQMEQLKRRFEGEGGQC